MIPVLFEIEMKLKLMIQEGNRSVYAVVNTCRGVDVQSLLNTYKVFTALALFLCESVYACGIHVCVGRLCGLRATAFPFFTPRQGGVCVGVITDYAVSFLPLAELVVSEGVRRSSLTVFHHNPSKQDLRRACTHDKHVCVLFECTHRSHSRTLWGTMGSCSDGNEEPFLVPPKSLSIIVLKRSLTIFLV